MLCVVVDIVRIASMTREIPSSGIREFDSRSMESRKMGSRVEKDLAKIKELIKELQSFVEEVKTYMTRKSRGKMLE